MTRVSDIAELNEFNYAQLRSVWNCYGEIEGLKRSFFGKDDDEIEKIAGTYFDEMYDDYKYDAVYKKKLLTPEQFDSVYTAMISASKPLVFNIEQK